MLHDAIQRERPGPRDDDLPAVLLGDPRWHAVLNRDAKADGRFVYSVATTGVYCRPSCGARRPRPENVRFHATPEAAENAGFRPCKRCRPKEVSATERNMQLVAKLCREIEDAEAPLRLEELAASAGLSPFHLHRLFKSVTGVTPRAYMAAQRRKRVHDELPRRDTVTAAMYEAGYNSSGHFYADSNGLLGMTPGDFRRGGAGVVIHFACGQASLGRVLVASTERGLCAILLGDDEAALIRELHERFPKASITASEEAYRDVVRHVVAFVDAPHTGLSLPLDVRGTAFQQRVWQALREIPAGKTASYTEIATRIGMPKAIRAVASACAANPLAVAIPCHRALRNDGALAGYRWGLDRKRALLDLEAENRPDVRQAPKAGVNG